MKTSLFLCIALAVCGCSTLGGDRHAGELSDARADDGYCVDHGLHYPDPAYLQCRRQLVDRRLYRDWQNLRVMKQSGQPAMPSAPPPTFRAPDPAGFHCHAEPQFGDDYVICGYDEGVGAAG